MKFPKYVGRRIILRIPSSKELKEFDNQVEKYPNVRDAFDTKGRNGKYEFDYVVIKDKSYNLIGIIKISRVKEYAYINICIPNEAFRIRYGTEALHKFIKQLDDCTTRKLYKLRYLYLAENNSIIETYKRERPEMFTKTDDRIIRIKETK